jgi:hypothetical protein
MTIEIMARHPPLKTSVREDNVAPARKFLTILVGLRASGDFPARDRAVVSGTSTAGCSIELAAIEPPRRAKTRRP